MSYGDYTRENIINKETAVKKVNELYAVSSLFITKGLIEHVVKSVKEFKK